MLQEERFLQGNTSQDSWLGFSVLCCRLSWWNRRVKEAREFNITSNEETEKFSPKDPVLHHHNYGISVYQELNSTLHFTSAEHFPTAHLWWFNLSFCFALKKWIKQHKLSKMQTWPPVTILQCSTTFWLLGNSQWLLYLFVFNGHLFLNSFVAI